MAQPQVDGSDWHDPELWGPPGQGCWNCHVNPAVVELEVRSGFLPGPGSVRFSKPYALCLECLGLWFPGWGGERVLDWLIRQTERQVAWGNGAAARAEADKQSLKEWLA